MNPVANAHLAGIWHDFGRGAAAASIVDKADQAAIDG